MWKKAHLFMIFAAICTAIPVAAPAKDATLCVLNQSHTYSDAFGVNWERGSMYGIGVCTDSDQGAYTDSLPELTATANSLGAYCYCRMLYPRLSKYVKRNEMPDCSSNCATSCASLKWEASYFE